MLQSSRVDGKIKMKFYVVDLHFIAPLIVAIFQRRCNCTHLFRTFVIQLFKFYSENGSISLSENNVYNFLLLNVPN